MKTIKEEMIEPCKTKHYRDYVIQAVNRGNKEYIPYLKHLSRDGVRPYWPEFSSCRPKDD